MSDQFMEDAMANMGAVERLVKGLPGINGYVEKELRRDADKRVRDSIAQELQRSKDELHAIQNQLLKGGGLRLIDDLDEVSVRLQTLIDRIRTASYGYAGLFDPVRIKEEQLDALYRFDLALARQVGTINGAITELSAAVDQKTGVEDAIVALNRTVTDMSKLFDRREEALLAPELLSQPDYAPPAADPGSDPNAVG